MKLFNNITDLVKDDLAVTMMEGSKVSIAAACFSIYAYKELKVNEYYQTYRIPEEDLPLKLEGLSIDAVYENFVS